GGCRSGRPSAWGPGWRARRWRGRPARRAAARMRHPDRRRVGRRSPGRPARAAVGVREAELARVAHAVRVEGGLHRGEDTEPAPEGTRDEAGPVEADAVVVAERSAAGEDRLGA